MKKIQKISIIGAGAIGTQTALYLQQEAMYLQKNFLREIILYNHNYDLAYGEASDIVDSMAFHEQFSGIEKLDCKVIPSYQLKDIEGSDIIIVAAGAAKTALKHKNRSLELPVTYQIAKKLAIAIKKYAKHALVIVISNPVDLITWYIQEFSGLPKNKVMGVGVAADSARYAYNLKEELKNYNVKIESVKSIVIGAHRGKDMLMVESMIKVNDHPITELKKYNLTEENIKEVLYKAKEQTYERGDLIAQNKRQRTASINPATIASTIASLYLRKKTIKLPMALVINKEDLKKYNIDFNKEVCTGIMAIIGPEGAEVEGLELNEKEKNKLIAVMQETVNLKECFEADMGILKKNKFLIDKKSTDSENNKKYIFNDENDFEKTERNSDLNLYANNDNMTS